jgi:phosphoglycerate kinase
MLTFQTKVWPMCIAKILGHSGDIGLALELDVDVNWDLRSDPREESNDISWAKELALGFDVYVNESFATSHRQHASIVALPQYIKSAGGHAVAGLRFVKEIETLEKVGSSANNLLVVGGTKVKDKNKYADELKSRFTVLRGGLLDGSPLREDGLDITTEAIVDYKAKIATAEIIVAAGVMGKYEDPAAEEGTKEILLAIAASKAYKIAGGGDIETAISKYGLNDKFDWISVGGGAMLEFLASGTLPGIEALLA